LSILQCIRPELRSLRPYQAAEQVDDTIRLNANEAPWSASADNFRRPLNRYPEVRPARLSKMLAEIYGCDTSNLVITRGTSEGIDLLIRVFCGADRDSIVTVTPTFSMYRHYAAVQGARVIDFAVSPDNDFAIDVDALMAVCDETVRIVFLCSPNNPTGNSLARADLVRILQRCEKQAAVVVDEAYVEYSEHASVVDLLADYENLIVLRTLSKALGCAGARCGSVIAAEAATNVLAAVQSPYALATPVVECIENALADNGFSAASQRAAETCRERLELVRAIKELRLVEYVWPSDANFFLMRVADAPKVMRHCASHGVLLRDFGKDMPGCIRVSVGSPTENRRLLEVLGSIEGGA